MSAPAGPMGPSDGRSTAAREQRPAAVLDTNHDEPAGLDNPRAPRRRTGMRNIEKYAWLLAIAMIFTLVLGSYVLLTFDPTIS